MKDKLRELAEGLHVIAATEARSDYAEILIATANAITELLDAEGDGGAVDTGNLVNDPLYLALDALYERGWNDSEKHKHDARGTNEWQRVLDLFRVTHPARSGVVSDEQVEESIKIFWSILGDPKNHLVVGTSLVAMRAALTHFAKSQGDAG